MKTTNGTISKFIGIRVFMILMFFAFGISHAQEVTGVDRDSTSTTFSFGNLTLPNPNSIVSKYTYDSLTDRYIYNEIVGNFNINYPVILTPAEYQKLILNQVQMISKLQV